MDNDFNEAIAYKLVGDDGFITVAAITETVDGEEIEYTEVTTPMSEMNTVEFAAWLGTEKSKSGLHGELVGFDRDGKQVFIVQIENFIVRNRITSIGDPTPIQPDYLTAAQVRALIGAGMECEFRTDCQKGTSKNSLLMAFVLIPEKDLFGKFECGYPQVTTEILPNMDFSEQAKDTKRGF